MRQKQKQNHFLKLLFINAVIVLGVLGCFFYLGRYEIVVVDSLALNVRTGPGMTFDIQAQAKKGQELTILEEKNKWYHVRLGDNSTGWIASWLVTKGNASATTNISATVNNEETKLRKEGNTEAAILETLAPGEKVTITSEQDGWSKVQYKKVHGWIRSDLLDVSTTKEKENPPANKTLYAREDDTKIRAEASIESDILTTLKYGDSITYTGASEDWFEVKTADGQTGYVANWVVSLTPLDKEDKKSATSIAEATIVLDPGHGGSDPGAESNNGKTFEKEITLKTALAVKDNLEKLGANVIMTRSKDTDVGLARRAKISNDANADIFISFHYDSTEVANEGSGTTTYFYAGADKKLAETVNFSLEKKLPLPNRGVLDENFQVLRDNTQPALLIELGYMNNDGDYKEAKTKSYQKKVAKAISTALQEYIK